MATRAAARRDDACSRCSCLARRCRPAAQGHRARVSADLADHLTAGSQNIDVIVHGTPAEVNAIAKRYNVKITKNLETARCST